MLKKVFVLVVALCSPVLGSTQIKVINNYKKEINVKIQGSGVGGCDVIMQAGEENDADCWCLWGTINYSFCAFQQGHLERTGYNETETTVSNGRCPVAEGEAAVCSDLSGLGNCYNGGYVCTIDSEGLCHCD